MTSESHWIYKEEIIRYLKSLTKIEIEGTYLLTNVIHVIIYKDTNKGKKIKVIAIGKKWQHPLLKKDFKNLLGEKSFQFD